MIKMKKPIFVILIILLLSGCVNQSIVSSGKGIKILRFDVSAQIDKDGKDVIEMGKSVLFELELENYHNEAVDVDVEVFDKLDESNMDFSSTYRLESAEYIDKNKQVAKNTRFDNINTGSGNYYVIPGGISNQNDIHYSRIFPQMRDVGDYSVMDSFAARVIAGNLKTTGIGQACIIDMNLNEDERSRIGYCGAEQVSLKGGNNEYAPIAMSVYKTISRSGDGTNTKVMFEITLQNVGGGRINNADQHFSAVSISFGGTELRCNKDASEISLANLAGLSRQITCWGDFDMSRQKMTDKILKVEVTYDYVVEKVSNPPTFEIIKTREW